MTWHRAIFLLTLSPAFLACSGPPRFTTRPYEAPELRPASARSDESAPSRSRFDEIVHGLLGTRYRYGGRSLQGFDCSGLVQHIYNEYDGTRLPRTVTELFDTGGPVRRDEWRSGDLVFFSTRGQEPSHVGIYLGRDRFVHASPGDGVTIASMQDPYYDRRYIGARRLLD
jgi:cell wall-associated NlpC family hydrolase